MTDILGLIMLFGLFTPVAIWFGAKAAWPIVVEWMTVVWHWFKPPVIEPPIDMRPLEVKVQEYINSQPKNPRLVRELGARHAWEQLRWELLEPERQRKLEEHRRRIEERDEEFEVEDWEDEESIYNWQGENIRVIRHSKGAPHYSTDTCYICERKNDNE